MQFMIRRIIDRDCHVSWTNRRVIRHVISRLSGKYRTFRKMDRHDRRQLMRHCVATQRHNRLIYDLVMRGR